MVGEVITNHEVHTQYSDNQKNSGRCREVICNERPNTSNSHGV